MFYKHLIIKKIDYEELILFLDLNYEFALFNEEHKSIKKMIQNYIKTHKIKFNGKKVLIAVGGILIASLTINSKYINFDSFKNDDVVAYVQSSSLKSVSNIKKQENPDNQNSKVSDNTNKNLSVDKTTNKKVVSNNKKSTSSHKKTTSNSNIKKNVLGKKDTSNTNKKNTNFSTSKFSNTSIKVTVYRSSGKVEILNLEDYVVGVVASEMPASFNAEALKSQAILARTYALKSIQTGKKLTDTVSTQEYIDISGMKKKWGSDYSKYYNKIKNAVDSTKGIYITYNNEIIEAVYHSTSNGYTEDPIEVWGYSLPYLKSIKSPLDLNATSYKRVVTKEKNYILKLFGINSLEDIKILKRNNSGRVSQVKIGNNIYSGIDIREILGLRSADFDFEISEDGLIITTRGYGHGVGLSQYGANLLAQKGYTYSQIINYYYTNVKLMKK